MSKRPKKMDLNQLAKRIVDEATGEVKTEEEIYEKKKAVIESGRLDYAHGNAQIYQINQWIQQKD